MAPKRPQVVWWEVLQTWEKRRGRVKVWAMGRDPIGGGGQGPVGGGLKKKTKRKKHKWKT